MTAQSFGRFRWLILLTGAIWAIQIVNMLTLYGLNGIFGLEPRAIDGLPGVPLMPLLHASIMHAASNTPPLLVLGALMTLTAPQRLVPVSAIVVIGGGLAVWLVGRDALHVGASGLIFGWFGYLVARGVVERSLKSLAVAGLVVVLYGTMIFGLLPMQRISWESHLFGFIAGIGAAWRLRRSA